MTITVSAGYAALMGRYSLPWFHTQTFAFGGPGDHRPRQGTVAALIGGTRYARAGTHPEAVAKAHRHFLGMLNDELHGNHWRRRKIVGAQSVLGIERHKSGQPHSHAVIGHADLDLAAREFDCVRHALKQRCEKEWGYARVDVAKSQDDANAYVSKYIVKDGEIVISENIEALATGQLALLHSTLRPAARPTAARSYAHA